MYDFETMLNNCGIQQVSLDKAKTVLESAAIYKNPKTPLKMKNKIQKELIHKHQWNGFVPEENIFIVLDKDGCINNISLIKQLEEAEFTCRVFSVCDFDGYYYEHRNLKKYNPLLFLRRDTDIIQLASYMIDVLMEHTSSDIYFTGGRPFNWNLRQGNIFWNKAMKTLLTAYIALLVEDAPPNEITFDMVLQLIKSNSRPEYDEEYKTTVDIMFERREDKAVTECREFLSVKQYQLFKNSSAYYKNCINDYLGYLLSIFDNNDIKDFTSDNELDFGIFNGNCVIFIEIPSYDDIYLPLVKLLLYQIAKYIEPVKVTSNWGHITLFK